MRFPTLLAVVVCCALLPLAAVERAELFAVPDLQALPLDIQVMSERTEDGVAITELTMAGAPHNGEPTRIYGFYCRPVQPGRYPAVLEIHGAGLDVLKPTAGIGYAKNGFACFVMDWAGECPERKRPRKPPFSQFAGKGNLAYGTDDKTAHPPHGWRTYGVEQDGIGNGVRFARRAARFLASRPEVDPDRLCVAGMSAGAHLTLLLCGVEPMFKAAAVKYGRGFIRELAFGGYFGPILMCPRDQQDAWLAAYDPKHGLPAYRAKVLMLSGTDDIFFWMPGVLATHRAIPTEKRLVMFPNENHGYVGNWEIPLAWFRTSLGMDGAWADPQRPTATAEGGQVRLALAQPAGAPAVKAVFVVKRMPKAVFTWGMGDKAKPETLAKWVEVPAERTATGWSAAIPAPGADEQIVAYANVTDAQGRLASSDTVELPAYPQWYGRADGAGWKQEVKAGEFRRASLQDPLKIEAARRTGSLRALAKDEKADPAIGWYEYETWVPVSGWYELTVPGGQGIDYRVVDAEVVGTDGQGRVGSFWLERGLPQTIRLERTHWTGFPATTGFSLRQVAVHEVQARIRPRLLNDRTVLRQGERVRLAVRSGDLWAPAVLGVRLSRAGTVLQERTIALSDAPGERTEGVELPCEAEGTLRVEFLVDGKPADHRNLAPIDLLVVDTALRSGQDRPLATVPVAEIDCTTQEPPYAKGPTRVVTTRAGTYRETGAVGYLPHMNGTEPTWFAYPVAVPEAQRLYRIEVDYPDDALRTCVIAVRESMGKDEAYPTAGGYDSGGEFSLSGRMQTHTLLHWARTTDLRILVIPALDGRRGAAARIRVAQVQDGLPPLRQPSKGGRSFANWYEEGSNFAPVFGAPDRSLAGRSVAADRWAATTRHQGGDTLWMTMVVYQFGLYPSRYNVQFGSRHSPDLVRTVLLNCERRGMGFIGEFHPEGRELDWPVNADLARQHRAVRHDGRLKQGNMEPIYNPLWPANRAWYLGMIGEFVERYQDSPSLRGVCLRLMTWTNPGLNNFHSLEWGYDDYTIARFEQDTGIRIPVEAGDAKRFRRRHAWLLAERREAWIGWRCAQIEQLYREVVARIRRVRPDLVVYSNWGMELADPREAGIDPVRLQAIPGVVLVGGAPYGRRKGDELVVQGLRDELVDRPQLRRFLDADGRGAFLDGAGYFEATGDVVPPADLGFPADSKRFWMAGVVNPAGVHANERWAVQLAEADAAFLADGGNAYTVGQPVLREFMAEYRWIPALPFQRRDDATDPVAVWSREVSAADLRGIGADPADPAGIAPGFHLYAVNRDRHPARVAIALAGAGQGVVRPATGATEALADGVLVMELAPYEVRTFRARPGAVIRRVEVVPAPEARRHAEGLAAFLATLAAEAAAGTLPVPLRPEQVALLAARAAEARAGVEAGRVWRVRVLAEHRDLRVIYDRLQRQPPGLRDLGDLQPPVGAIAPRALQGRIRSGSATVAVAARGATWAGDEVLVTSGPLEVELDVPTDGLNGIQVGATGSGPVEVTADGRPVGILAGPGLAGRPLALHRGPVRIGLRPVDGGPLAIRHLALMPVFTDLVMDRWSAIGPFPAGDDGEAVLAAMRAPAWQPVEAGWNPGAEVVVDGRALRWTPLTGSGDFVDLKQALSGGSGTISYAATRIRSPEAARVRLRYGMDYWMRIWLNGVLVKDVEPRGGAPYKGQFALDVDLRPGDNDLLVKVAAGRLGNGFWIELGETGALAAAAPL